MGDITREMIDGGLVNPDDPCDCGECTIEECNACHEPVTCAYCGATDGLRAAALAYGSISADPICEDCFTATDDGPGFDDLPKITIQVSG